MDSLRYSSGQLKCFSWHLFKVYSLHETLINVGFGQLVSGKVSTIEIRIQHIIDAECKRKSKIYYSYTM